MCIQRTLRSFTLTACFFTAGASVAVHADDSPLDRPMGWWSGTEQTGGYVGASAGTYENDEFLDSNDDGSLAGTRLDDRDTGWSVFTGYRFNRHFGLEAGYVDLGEQSFRANSSGGESWEAGAVGTDYDADGWYVSGIARYPVNDRFALLVRLGLFRWESTERWTEPSGVSEEKDSGTDAEYALGAEYDIGVSDKWFFRVMYGSVDTDDDSVQTESLNAGLYRNF